MGVELDDLWVKEAHSNTSIVGCGHKPGKPAFLLCPLIILKGSHCSIDSPFFHIVDMIRSEALLSRLLIFCTKFHLKHRRERNKYSFATNHRMMEESQSNLLQLL